MIFARGEISITERRVVRVVTMDVPFDESELSNDPDRVTVGLGAAFWRDWVDREGVDCSPGRHMVDALANIEVDPEQADHPQIRQTIGRLLACPTTYEEVSDKLRREGPFALPTSVRAWLTLAMRDEDLRGLGPIWAGIPPSVIVAMERQRNKRNEKAGSQLEAMMRNIQNKSDQRSAIALQRRVIVASAWQDVVDAVPAKRDPEAEDA